MANLPFSIFKQNGQEYEVVDKKVRSDLYDEISITPNGTETWAQAYARLFALIPSGDKLKYNILEEDISNIVGLSKLEVYDGTGLTYHRVYASAAALTTYQAILASTSANCKKGYGQVANGGTLNYTDQSSQVCNASKLALRII